MLKNIHTEASKPFIFAASTAAKVADLKTEEDSADLKLGAHIRRSDYAGLFYEVTPNEVGSKDTTTLAANGVPESVDPIGYQHIAGAEIECKNDLEGTRLIIKNSPSGIAIFGCAPSLSPNVGISS